LYHEDIRWIQERVRLLRAMPPPCICVANPSHFAVLEFNPLYGNWNWHGWIGFGFQPSASLFHPPHCNLIQQKHGITLLFLELEGLAVWAQWKAAGIDR